MHDLRTAKLLRLPRRASMPYRGGQPQGIAPTEDRIFCRGNPLWLPATIWHFCSAWERELRTLSLT